jgi:hypothetical protein
MNYMSTVKIECMWALLEKKWRLLTHRQLEWEVVRNFQNWLLICGIDLIVCSQLTRVSLLGSRLHMCAYKLRNPETCMTQTSAQELDSIAKTVKWLTVLFSYYFQHVISGQKIRLVSLWFILHPMQWMTNYNLWKPFKKVNLWSISPYRMGWSRPPTLLHGKSTSTSGVQWISQIHFAACSLFCWLLSYLLSQFTLIL